MKGCTIALFLILSNLGFGVTLLAAQQDNPVRYREARYVMGTLLDITLYRHDAQRARKTLDEAFSLAQKLDDLLSNYKPQSEVSRLNGKAGQGRVKISPELFELLNWAKSLSQRTGGAFDITVGPLMNLWEDAHEKRELPSSDSIKAAGLLVGAHHITLHSNFEVEMAPKGVKIDTGGIGKGYAVDKIVELFRTRAINRALINFGHSSIYALGSPPQAHAWKLLTQFPGQSPLGILNLNNQAFSASDSLGGSFEIAGRKYGHIIDPRTGIPVTQRIQAVVLTPSATEGEALGKYVILEGWKNEYLQKSWGEVQMLRVGERGEIQHSKDFPLNVE